MKKTAALFILFFLTSADLFGATFVVDQSSKEASDSIKLTMLKAKPGDTVYIKEGIYDEHLLLKEGVTIQGSGAGVTRIEYSGKGPAVYAKGIKNSFLKNISITCKGEEKRSVIYLVDSEVTLADSIVFGGTLSGIEAKDKSVLRVVSSTIQGNLGSGIFLYNGASGQVEKSRVLGNRYFGIDVKEGSVFSSKENLVARNLGSGVSVSKDGSLEIVNSQILDNRFYGILINEKGRANIINNNIMGNQKAGIIFGSDSTSVIQNNILMENEIGMSVLGTNKLFSTYNNFWHNGEDLKNLAKGEGDKFIDPLFTEGFKLAKDSPMIKAGFNGKDIGAFPFEAENITNETK